VNNYFSILNIIIRHFARFIDDILELIDEKSWAAAKDKNGETKIMIGYGDKRIKRIDQRSIVVFFDSSKSDGGAAATRPGIDYTKAHHGYNFVGESTLSEINTGF